MALSGFNQEDGTVTGNVQNLTIESKQNSRKFKYSTKWNAIRKYKLFTNKWRKKSCG